MPARVTYKVLFLFCMLLLTAIRASAQDDNIGYYELISDDGVTAVWGLVWSDYVPGAENEPIQPGDIYVYAGGPGGGGWCDPNTGICYDPQGGGAGLYDDDKLPLPDVTVTGSPIHVASGTLGMWLLPSVSLNGGGGGAIGWGRVDGPPPECNTGQSEVDDNQDDLIELWEDSGFVDIKALRERSNYSALEQAAFIKPDGTYIDLSAIGALNNQTACSFAFNVSVMETLSIPSGTIFIHSHPWSDGDDQTSACGPPQGGVRRIYQSRPGSGDTDALEALNNFYDEELLGAIIDGDQIIFYDEEYENEGDEVGQSDRCY